MVEQINIYLDGSTSPVSKGRFKKFKKDKGPSHLLEDGDLRSSIRHESAKGGIRYGIFNSEETGKAYGHNSGFKGHPSIPSGKYTRQFIPDSGQILKKPIIDGIKRIIKEDSAS